MAVIEFTICFYQATIRANNGEFSTIADDARRHQDKGIGARDGTRCCWRPQASVLLSSLSVVVVADRPRQRDCPCDY